MFQAEKEIESAPALGPDRTVYFGSRDCGEFVRCREDYVRLAEGRFSKVETFVQHDLLRIPYTHLIMRSHKGG